MLKGHSLDWSLLKQWVMISIKSNHSFFMWPGVIAGSAHADSVGEGESSMRQKMNELLSSDCMWHMCGCCWLKVVVVIAELKMPGGGYVPLIPYLISRSRGEALNPKHTHTLTHSLAATYAHTHTSLTKSHMHTHMFTVLLVNYAHNTLKFLGNFLSSCKCLRMYNLIQKVWMYLCITRLSWLYLSHTLFFSVLLSLSPSLLCLFLWLQWFTGLLLHTQSI